LNKLLLIIQNISQLTIKILVHRRERYWILVQIKSIIFLFSHRLNVIGVDNKNYNFRCVQESNLFRFGRQWMNGLGNKNHFFGAQRGETSVDDDFHAYL
jgi:hypothetical protein